MQYQWIAEIFPIKMSPNTMQIGLGLSISWKPTFSFVKNIKSTELVRFPTCLDLF